MIRQRVLSFFLVLTLLCLINFSFFRIQKAFALEWNIEDIDGGTKYAAVTVDYQNRPHLAYSGDRYAFYDGIEKWYFEKLSGWELYTKTYEGSSISVDADGIPHLFYRAESPPGKYIYAYKDGESWSSHEFGGAYIYTDCRTSIAIDSAGHPHLTYPLTYYVYYQHFNGTNWMSEIVENRGGLRSEVKLDQNDFPHIAFARGAYGENTVVGYKWKDENQWNKEYIEMGGYVHDVSLVIDSSIQPHFAVCSGGLKHAYKNEGVWQIQSIESNIIAADVSMAIDAQGILHVAYCDTTNGLLKYGYYDDGSWHIETVDQGEIAAFVSLDLDQQSQIHIAYFNGSILKLAQSISLDHPAALFSCSPSDGQVGLQVQFNDKSTGFVTSWLWDFGDGRTSTEQNPVITYENPGRYDVTLTASGPAGLSSKRIKRCVWTYDLPKNKNYSAYVGEINKGSDLLNRLTVIDCSSKEIVQQTLLPENIFGVTTTLDGRSIYVSQSPGGAIVKFNATNFSDALVFSGIGGAAGSTVSPDNQHVFVGSSANYVTRISVADDTATIVQIPPDPGEWNTGTYHSIAITPEGDSLFLATGALEFYTGYTLKILYPDSGTPQFEAVRTGANSSLGGGVCITPDGRFIYLTNSAGGGIQPAIYKLPIDDLRPFRRKQIYLDENPFKIQVSPDGKWLYATKYPNELVIIDTTTDQIVKTLPIAGDPRGVAFTPDGNFAYVCAFEKVFIVDANAQEIEKEIYTGAHITNRWWPFSIAIAPVPYGCEGDFEPSDGDVDGSDFAVFAADFGQTNCSGDCECDFDRNGDCDGSDLTMFAADFGRTECSAP